MSSPRNKLQEKEHEEGVRRVRELHHALRIDRLVAASPLLAASHPDTARFLLGALESFLAAWMEAASAALLAAGAKQLSSLDLQASLRMPALAPVLDVAELALPCEALLDDKARAKLLAAGVGVAAASPFPAALPADWARRPADPVAGAEARALLRRLNPVVTMSEGAVTLVCALARAWLACADVALERLPPEASLQAILPALLPPALLRRCGDAGELACLVFSPRLALPPACTLRMQLLDGTRPVGSAHSLTLPRRERLTEHFKAACGHYGILSPATHLLLYHGVEASHATSADALGVIRSATLYIVTQTWWAEEGQKVLARNEAAAAAASAAAAAAAAAVPGAAAAPAPALAQPAAVAPRAGGGGGGGSIAGSVAVSGLRSGTVSAAASVVGGHGGGGGGGGGGARRAPGAAARSSPSAFADSFGSAIESAAAGRLRLNAAGFADGGGGGSAAGSAAGSPTEPVRGMRGSGGGLGSSPERWGRQPRLQAASAVGRALSPRDAAGLLGSALRALSAMEDAIGSLTVLAAGEGGGGGGGSGGSGSAVGGPEVGTSFMDLRQLRATALDIANAGKELNRAVSTVEANLAREALVEDTRRFAARAQKVSSGEKARRMSPFKPSATQGLSPRR